VARETFGNVRNCVAGWNLSFAAVLCDVLVECPLCGASSGSVFSQRIEHSSSISVPYFD